MKTSKRFENAIQKLYTAFHNNTLHPESCTQCAVGNILNGKDYWKHLSDEHGALQLNYIGKVHTALGRTFEGFSPLELLQIEAAFLKGCGYSIPLRHNTLKPKDPTHKDILFRGLSAAVACLCKLDNIKNVMDCSTLFNYKTSKVTSSNIQWV